MEHASDTPQWEDKPLGPRGELGLRVVCYLLFAYLLLGFLFLLWLSIEERIRPSYASIALPWIGILLLPACAILVPASIDCNRALRLWERWLFGMTATLSGAFVMVSIVLRIM